MPAGELAQVCGTHEPRARGEHERLQELYDILHAHRIASLRVFTTTLTTSYEKVYFRTRGRERAALADEEAFGTLNLQHA